jgi:hypothetical protein
MIFVTLSVNLAHFFSVPVSVNMKECNKWGGGGGGWKDRLNKQPIIVGVYGF